MITTIFYNGISNLKALTELKSLQEAGTSIGLIFDTTESAEQFVAQFPKTMNIRARRIKSCENDKMTSRPYVCCQKMSTKSWRKGYAQNKITGETNESGDRKLARFYAAVKAQLELENKS